MANVQFRNLDYKVPNIHILKSLNGEFASGRLTAIMAPSGHGKSTLLNILAGRMGAKSVKGSTLTGEISLGGVLVDPIKARSQISYVMSEDAFHAAQTPEDAVTFSLALREPHLSALERKQRVDGMLKQLGLESCRKVLIGDEMIKGISSGQRKRTAIACEIIHNPLCCFLDEPTTGLDSFTAFQIVTLLKKLASEGRCIVATIHQPSSEVFATFDDVVLMHKGSLIYHGPVKEMRGYFDKLGYVCPVNYNPADYVTELIQTLDPGAMQKLVENFPSQIYVVAKEEVRPATGSFKASRSKQVAFLLRRELQNTWRDPRVLAARFGMTVFLACLTSGLMWKQGESHDKQARIAVLTNLVIGTLFGVAQPLVLTLPLEKPIFIREFSSGLYDVLSYFFAKIAVEIPIGATQAAIMAVIGYYMGGYGGNFGVLYVAAYVNAVCSASYAFAISAIARSPREAVEITPILFVSQFLFANLFISISDIAIKPIRALQWITPLKYAVSIAYIGEFKYDAQGREIMNDADVSEHKLGFYIGILLLLAAVGRIFGIIGLRIASKRTVF